jgi:hypothetical protein
MTRTPQPGHRVAQYLPLLLKVSLGVRRGS